MDFTSNLACERQLDLSTFTYPDPGGPTALQWGSRDLCTRHRPGRLRYRQAAKDTTPQYAHGFDNLSLTHCTRLSQTICDPYTEVDPDRSSPVMTIARMQLPSSFVLLP